LLTDYNILAIFGLLIILVILGFILTMRSRDSARRRRYVGRKNMQEKTDIRPVLNN
jgi:uncharacterized membrane protein (DUF373 family)